MYLLSQTGPDLKTGSLESLSSPLSQVPDLENHSECVQDDGDLSESSDEPVVQLDEEDVQPDMTLVGLRDPDQVRSSDDSDSPGDVPCG